ncbi:MAG: putative DNA binding domain-containing protein [Kiritimatiellae bacterium]|nr:putative DNA binding domain-containing protein [Kiritimatiellia bacterium]
MPEDYSMLIKRLLSVPAEGSTVEFKENNSNPESIGRYISGLANSAALKSAYDDAYVVWGVEDGTHRLIGTSFNPKTKKIKQQNLELWLRQNLSANADFTFITHKEDEKEIVILRIKPALRTPVTFMGKTYIRTGSSLQELKSENEKARQLWSALEQTPYEERPALRHTNVQQVLSLLDYTRYFTQTNTPMPDNDEEILGYLEKEKLITRQDSGQWAITNVGALLFAHSLDDFHDLSRKALRIVHYYGTRRTAQTTRADAIWGYADFDRTFTTILDELPARENIDHALRQNASVFPRLALRELLANMLIHQDLSVAGAGPLVEIFDGRIEFSNPGTSLIDVNRLVNDPPQSRNPLLSRLSRRLGMCEEAGSGWDKIIDSCEDAHLPPLAVTVQEDPPSMRVVMRQERSFKLLTVQERIEAAYWHACVQYANNDFLTNTSLRERFALPSANSTAISQVSRVIREAVDMNLLRPFDAEASRKNMRYVPGWA